EGHLLQNPQHVLPHVAAALPALPLVAVQAQQEGEQHPDPDLHQPSLFQPQADGNGSQEEDYQGKAGPTLHGSGMISVQQGRGSLDGPSYGSVRRMTKGKSPNRFAAQNDSDFAEDTGPGICS